MIIRTVPKLRELIENELNTIELRTMFNPIGIKKDGRIVAKTNRRVIRLYKYSLNTKK